MSSYSTLPSLGPFIKGGKVEGICIDDSIDQIYELWVIGFTELLEMKDVHRPSSTSLEKGRPWLYTLISMVGFVSKLC